MIGKVKLDDVLATVDEPWRPRIVGDLNDIRIEVVKLKGEFVWRHHDDVAEAFIVLNGSFRVRFRDHDVDLGPGELIVIPPNVEHMPTSEDGCEVILLEPRSTVNTGNVVSERTVSQPESWSAAR